MLIDESTLKGVRSRHRNQTIALRLGCFDVLHSGHQEALDYTASQADILVVGVMPDRYVKKMKGADRPVHSEVDRALTIATAESVDYSLVVGADMVALAGLFYQLRPDVYVEGADHRPASLLKSVFLRHIGTELVVDSKRPGSSSEIIAHLGVAEAAVRSSLQYRHVEPGQAPTEYPTTSL